MSKQDGSTLVEVVISLLLTSVMVSAIFTVLLAAKESGGKADRKLLGSEAVASLQEALKAYATDSASMFSGGPGPQYTVNSIKGPNATANCGGGNCAAGWYINTTNIQDDRVCNIPAPFGSAQPTGLGASGRTIYALDSSGNGNHCLVCTASAAGGADTACFLPKILRDPPYNGIIFYNVQSGSPPSAQVGVWWTEP